MNPLTLNILRGRYVAFLGTAALVMSSSPSRADDVPAGERVTFAASADGSPAPEFIWKKDGKEIARGPTFVIVSMAPAHDGSYVVTAVNNLGQADSPPYVLKTIALPPVPLPPPPVISEVKAVTEPKP